MLIQLEVNFFDVARAYGVAPRVLMAWLEFESEKWENDATLGRGPGPDETYDGVWPTHEEELERYMTMGMNGEHFADDDLRKRYLEYRAQRLKESAAAKAARTKRTAK